MFLEIMDVSFSLITTYCGCKADYTTDILQTIKNYFLHYFKYYCIEKYIKRKFKIIHFSRTIDLLSQMLMKSIRALCEVGFTKGLIWTKFKLLLHILVQIPKITNFSEIH